jgi:hypothetical protein
MRVAIVRRSAGSTRLPISSKNYPALPFGSVFKIAQPPIASLVSVIGSSVTVVGEAHANAVLALQSLTPLADAGSPDPSRVW